MSVPNQKMIERLQARFGDLLLSVKDEFGEVTIEVPAAELHRIAVALRDESGLGFEQLIDLCGVDYQDYGDGSWQGKRFAVVYHLQSVSNNARLRVRVFLDDDEPRVESVADVWTVANWFEREAFDLYGILFDGHPDLRRLLTDYGFIGHPFRKDFPLIGQVEMRYDPERKRVVYEPVSIDLRVNVPRVIRHDNRYEETAKGE